jgi:hypothetical protein
MADDEVRLNSGVGLMRSIQPMLRLRAQENQGTAQDAVG